MKNKIILLIVGMFLLAGAVSGVEFKDLEGMTVQRSALMGQNFSDYTYSQLGCRIDSRGLELPSYRIRASCLTLQSVADPSRVKVIRENFTSEFLVTDFISCARRNGIQVCIRDYKNYLWGMLRDGAEVSRTKILKELETIDEVLPSWFEDLIF